MGLGIVVQIFKGKDDMHFSDCGLVKLLEHVMTVVERVLGKCFFKVVTVNEMQCGFCSIEEKLKLCLS